MNRWNTVEVIAAEGSEIGVEHDRDGKLTLVVRSPGQGWPGHQPDERSIQVVERGHRYIYRQERR